MSLRQTSELKSLPTRQLLDAYDGRPEICPICGGAYKVDVTSRDYGRRCPLLDSLPAERHSKVVVDARVAVS